MQYEQKSFDVHQRGAKPESCGHGWYRLNRVRARECVKCGLSESVCEALIRARGPRPLCQKTVTEMARGGGVQIVQCFFDADHDGLCSFYDP